MDFLVSQTKFDKEMIEVTNIDDANVCLNVRKCWRISLSYVICKTFQSARSWILSSINLYVSLHIIYLTKLELKLLEYSRPNYNNNNNIQEWYSGFIKDSPSGQLTSEMFIQMYTEVFPSGSAELFSQEAFRAFDTDGSGTIDFQGF